MQLSNICLCRRQAVAGYTVVCGTHFNAMQLNIELYSLAHTQAAMKELHTMGLCGTCSAVSVA